MECVRGNDDDDDDDDGRLLCERQREWTEREWGVRGKVLERGIAY